MAAKKQSKTDHQAKLERRAQLRQELIQLDREADRVSTELPAAQHRLREARQHQQSLQATVANDQGRGIANSSYRHSLDAKNNEVASLEAKVAELDKRWNQLQEERWSRQEELADLEAEGIPQEAVTEHMTALKQAQAEVNRIQGLIDEREAGLPDTESQEQELARLQEQREQLLADQALGKPVDEELATVDGAIEDLLADGEGGHAQAVQAYRDDSQALAGLRKRLAEAQERLKGLERKRPEVVDHYLMGQMEEEAAQYLAAATTLITSYRRLVALAGLAEENGQRKAEDVLGIGPTSGSWRQLKIPAFALKAFQGEHLQDERHGVLVDASVGPLTLEKARAEERERMADLGILF